MVCNTEMVATKQCNKCRKTLPVSGFFRRRGKPAAECKSCNMDMQRKWIARLRCGRIQDRKDALATGLSKVCSVCKSQKPYSDFWANSSSAMGTSESCIECLEGKRRGDVSYGFGRLRAAAKKRGIAVQISKVQYVEIIKNGACHFCGGSLPPMGGGLDRRDSSGCYSIENCVPCCTICNLTKSDRFSYEEMMLLAPTLRAIREKRASEGESTASSFTGAMRGNPA